MWGFHWRIAVRLYSQRGDKSIFQKFNWKHNVAAGWTHRSSSESVITPNNVQSCQAPLSLCLSPLKPSQISFVWMCNYLCCTEEKKQLASCNLLPRLEAVYIWKRGLCRQPALSPNIQNALALCCVSSPCCWHLWVSSASLNKDHLGRMWAKDNIMGFLLHIRLCVLL